MNKIDKVFSIEKHKGWQSYFYDVLQNYSRSFGNAMVPLSSESFYVPNIDENYYSILNNESYLMYDSFEVNY